MADEYIKEGFERGPLLSLGEATQQRSAVLSSYVESLTPTERTRAERHAETISQQGDRLPTFVALTPIAGHQENPETIVHALNEYASQKEAGPFTIILGLNYPSSQRDNPLIQLNLSAIEDAREFYPQLDIRVTEQSYPGATTIGRIRRDLWNSAVVAADQYNTEGPYREVVGYNQDIDLITLSPHFIKAAKEHTLSRLVRMASVPSIWAEGFIGGTFTRTKHAYDPRYPNTSKAVLWREFTTRQMDDNYFEAGVIIPFTAYAKNGGISGRHRLGEVLTLMAKEGNPSAKKIRHTPLGRVYSETSNRRYVERLHTNYFDDIWAPSSFSQSDKYRGKEDQLQDISHDRLEQLVYLGWQQDKDRILQDVYKIIDHGPYDEATIQKLNDLASRKLHIAAEVLSRAIGLPDFAESVERERLYTPRMLSSIYAIEVAARSYNKLSDPTIKAPR